MAKPETRLTEIYQGLSDNNRDTLLAFAEFLHAREPARAAPVPKQPLDIARPSDESVVAAIRRLRQTYPMVARSLVFSRTSELMSSHIVEGRDAVVVIDELEALFLNHYQQLSAPDDAR